MKSRSLSACNRGAFTHGVFIQTDGTSHNGVICMALLHASYECVVRCNLVPKNLQAPVTKSVCLGDNALQLADDVIRNVCTSASHTCAPGPCHTRMIAPTKWLMGGVPGGSVMCHTSMERFVKASVGVFEASRYILMMCQLTDVQPARRDLVHATSKRQQHRVRMAW